MTERNSKINEYSKKYEKKFKCNIIGSMYYIKSMFNCTNEELSKLIGLGVEEVELILDGKCLESVDTSLLSRLYVLTLGNMELPGCKMSDEEKMEVNKLIEAELECMRGETDAASREEKINEILSKLFDIYILVVSSIDITDEDLEAIGKKLKL